jgi:hypothetical protein
MLDKVKQLTADVRDGTKERPAVTVIVTCISVIGTIVVAGIGIVPTILDRGATIAALKAKNADLEKQVQDLTPPYTIHGLLRSTAGNKPILDAQLYVADANNQATLDDNGSFLVRNTFQREYWLVVVPPTGKIQRLLMNPHVPTGETADVAISWSFDKE